MPSPEFNLARFAEGLPRRGTSYTSEMKKLLAIAILSLVAASCAARDEKGRRIDMNDQFDYVVFDGHEYVIYNSGYHGGIAHSPKCECREKGGAR